MLLTILLTGPANTAYKGDGGPAAATTAGIAGSSLNFAMDRAGNFFIASSAVYIRYVKADTMIIDRLSGRNELKHYHMQFLIWIR